MRRGRPLIEIVHQAFLRGPSVYADDSAAVVTLGGGRGFALMGEKLPAGLGGLAGCEAQPGGAALAELVGEARKNLRKDANGWDLALAIAARAQLDYALVPALGRVLERTPDRVDVLVPGDNLPVARGALKLGCGLALAMHGKTARDIAAALKTRARFLDVARGFSPDMSTLALARMAIANDIPVYFPVPSRHTIQMGQGRLARLAKETVVDPQSGHALQIARNKWTTLSRLRMFGLPALPSGVVSSADRAVEVWRALGAPVAIKPVSGGKGAGISLNLDQEAQVRRGYEIAARYGSSVLVERYATGDDHRLTVVDGRMLAAAKRVAATVTGDGRRTVRELIDALNADPRRGPPFEKLMEYVRIDERLDVLLAQQGLALDAVPARGQVVKASLAANISQGGSAVDVTDIVHPDNRAAVEMAARACYALVVGVDFFTPDISRSWREGAGWILEVNTSPGFRPHWIANPDHDLMLPVLRVAFPEGAPARVPSAGVTGSIGKTTTCQMLAQIARAAGRHPGVSTSQGTWSGAVRLKEYDWAGGEAAMEMLTDPAVDLSIAEFARGGLLKKGMVLDGVDVAAVLNVLDNHVGIDGIGSREDLARIKAIPIRQARKWAFLNADDPLVLTMRDQVRAGVQVALVGTDPKNAELAKHRAAGGCTVTLDGTKAKPRVVVRDGDEVALELPLSSIPAASLMPLAAIATNAMFACGIALKLGITAEQVRAGLAQFTSDISQNPGRNNRIAGFPFDVLLTWADGTPALRELFDQLDGEARPAARRHLYLTVTGNRSDEWIRDMARAAAGHFDHYWCSELEDLRGRQEGEMAELLAQGLHQGGVHEDAITRMGGPTRRAGHMLDRIEPGAHVTLITFETALMLAEIERSRSRHGSAGA